MTVIYFPPKKQPPTDYPRADIMRMAASAIGHNGGPSAARVFFKFTCVRCGTRCTFDEPNRLYEHATCTACGVEQPVTRAGFALHVRTP